MLPCLRPACSASLGNRYAALAISRAGIRRNLCAQHKKRAVVGNACRAARSEKSEYRDIAGARTSAAQPRTMIDSLYPAMKSIRLLESALLAAATLPFLHGAAPSAIWADQCAKCHGEDGKGQTKMGKKLGIRDLTDAQVQAKFTDADAIKAIKEGIKDKDGKLAMKPIEGLTDAEIASLVPYVRTLKKP
jgi:mono/diheme cytochrome c family protein